jgi:hypothetical protein
MKRGPFVFWNILSAICWSMLNVFLGYFSGTLIVSIFKKWSSGLSLILFTTLILVIIYWLIKKRGQSLKTSFKSNSLDFVNKLKTYEWFNKLSNRYIFINDFFRESKNPSEKLFGSVILFSFLILTYILILILDVF